MFLVLHMAESATDENSVRECKHSFVRLERDYHDCQKYWMKKLSADHAAKAMIDQTALPAEGFFKIAHEQFFPALERGDRAGAAALLEGDLTRLYQQHRAVISNAIKAAELRTQEIERKSTERVDFWLSTIVVVAVLSVFGTAIIGSSITKSVLDPTADLIRRVEEVAASPDQRSPSLGVGSINEVGRLAKGIDAIISKLLLSLEQSRENQAQLRETKERLEALIAAAPIATIVLGADRIVYLWNKAAEEIFGWKEEEVVGRILPDDHSEMYEKLRAQVLSGTPIRNVQLMRKHKSGRLIPVLLHANPLHDAAGNVTGEIVLYDDITERIEAQEQLKRERDFNAVMLNIAPTLVVVIDTEGRVVVFNSACQRCTGYTFDEVKGKRFWECLMPEEEAKKSHAFWSRLMETPDLVRNDPLQTENLWLAKDGTLRRVA